MFRTTDNIAELRETIDIPRLEQYVRSAAPEISTPLRLQQFLHGQSNPTLLITDAESKQYVLRKKPPGELLSQTAHAIEREYRVMKSLEHTDIPVPKMYCLCEDKNIIGTPFYVLTSRIMQFMQGRIFTDPAMPDIQPIDRLACWQSALETLASLHRVDVISAGLESYGKMGGFYSRQLRTFDKLSPLQAAAVDSTTQKEVGAIPHWADLTSWFKQHVPADRISIVHGDYKIDNCVFHATENRVIGILDWELSTIGHPLSDLANLLQPFGLPSGEPGSSLKGFLGRDDLEGVPDLAEAQELYARVAGWSPIPDWTFAEAFSHLRLAVITQGIAARVARKQASSLKAVHHAKMFFPLGELAWSIIEERSADGISSKL